MLGKHVVWGLEKDGAIGKIISEKHNNGWWAIELDGGFVVKRRTGEFDVKIPKDDKSTSITDSDSPAIIASSEDDSMIIEFDDDESANLLKSQNAEEAQSDAEDDSVSYERLLKSPSQLLFQTVNTQAQHEENSTRMLMMDRSHR